MPLTISNNIFNGGRLPPRRWCASSQSIDRQCRATSHRDGEKRELQWSNNAARSIPSYLGEFPVFVTPLRFAPGISSLHCRQSLTPVSGSAPGGATTIDVPRLLLPHKAFLAASPTRSFARGHPSLVECDFAFTELSQSLLALLSTGSALGRVYCN